MLWIPWHFPLHLDRNIEGASLKAEHLLESMYPAVYQHLLQYKEELSARNKAETGIRYEWYALQRWGANYWEDFNKPKIIYPETTQGAYFAYDSNGMYIDKTCFMMLTNHAEYLQATLSSTLFEFAYKHIFSSIELGTNGYQYNKHALIKLPIKQIEEVPTFYTDEYFFNLYNLSKDEVDYIQSCKN